MALKNLPQSMYTVKKRILEKLEDNFDINTYQPLRSMMQYVEKHSNGTELVGVEIGVQFGKNALSILTNLPIKKLYLVDPYVDYISHEGVNAEKTFDMEFIYDSAKKRLGGFDEKTVFIRKYSADAINDIPDNLDFVYIDSNHSYEFIKREIELYYPKIKRNGGVIGGHDIWIPDITRAFMEFARDKTKYFIGDCTTQVHPDWWVVKE